MATTDKHLNALLDATARSIIAIDRQGQVTNISRRAKDRLNLFPGDSLATAFPDFWPPVNNILSGQSTQQTLSLQLVNAEFLVDINPLLLNNEICGAVCTLVDSLQLEAMTRNLPSFQTLSRELDTIIDSSSDGLFVCDAKRHPRQSGLGTDP
ncbi:MAG: hypothetical protein GXP51_04955 [Deltaproteobacteria bacterium]|nr:hypothetical protein [Deltaproteobacteria bacterium]